MRMHLRYTAGALALAAGVALGLAATGSAGQRAGLEKPRNTSRPTISGAAQEGSQLTASPGTWSGTTPISYAYRWLRCDRSGDGCAQLRETSSTYTLGRNDVGHTMRVRVTASNADGSESTRSAPTAVVASGNPTAPQNTSPPTVTGTPRQGETLHATNGTWTGSGTITFSYRWQRCSAAGSQCTDLRETSTSYRLGSNDVGRTIRVVVTARNANGSNTAVSAPVGPVTTTAPPPSGQCQSIASVSLPNRLVVDRITFTPARIVSRRQPLVARFHVTASNGGCVNGALVYALGVPFDRLSRAPEVQTDSTGWASVPFQVRPTFPLKRGNFVVIFVRARKGGEGVLGGVSTRRLVSVRIG